MTENLNEKLITEILEKLDQEYDLKARLGRYESATPELVDFASKNGIPDVQDAVRALFISDFIITSSEVPQGTTDDERRINIFECFIDALTFRSNNSDHIMRAFYLAYNLAVQTRRNDSFLSGRGVPPETRIIMLIDTLIMPYLRTMIKLFESDNCYFEVAIISSALLIQFPKGEIDKVNKEITLDSSDLFPTLFRIMSDFVKFHDAGVNDTVVLPNMDTSRILYINSSADLPLLSTWKTKSASNLETIDAINNLLKFLNDSDKEIPLVYLRGELKGSSENFILVRNPRVEGKPLCLFATPAEEINVSEMMSLLTIRSKFDKNWVGVENATKSIYDIGYEEKEIQKEEFQDKEIEETEEVDVQVESKPKSGGFFGKIKGLFGGKSDTTTETKKEKRVKKKTIREKVVKKVKEKIEKKTVIAHSMPAYLSQSIGVHALSDLRLFEIFDTIREAEYVVTGTLESNFAENKTTFLTIEDDEATANFAKTLDGLDSVIEAVINHYFITAPQILPTEILFLSKEDKRSIICFNGDKDRIIGTIAKTYEKDITKWREGDKSQETVQRRTLHMRTNQLLSARVHTPFDAATSRIYGNQITSDAKFITLDHAILPLESE